ncbi:MAG: prolipoprotein diacylglyceryl transferase [Mariniblastus sp.]|nr:prolipoprotein diacylglyceryl transferase [Mariniblastus sp.]
MYYPLFTLLGCIAGAIASRYTSKYTADRIKLSAPDKVFILLSGFCSAIIFAKLPFVLLSQDLLHNAGSILFSGKTVLLGLVGGYLGVELGKWVRGVKTKTGDTFAVPVAIAIGVGRLGCFFGGCCYGVETRLPWGVVFPRVDQLSRHPNQLYEAAFHLLMAGLLFWMLKNGVLKGQLIIVYFLAYFGFRFLTEFLRPEIDWAGGLSAYQWAIIVLVPIFISLWYRDTRSGVT